MDVMIPMSGPMKAKSKREVKLGGDDLMLVRKPRFGSLS